MGALPSGHRAKATGEQIVISLDRGPELCTRQWRSSSSVSGGHLVRRESETRSEGAGRAKDSAGSPTRSD